MCTTSEPHFAGIRSLLPPEKLYTPHGLWDPNKNEGGHLYIEGGRGNYLDNTKGVGGHFENA